MRVITEHDKNESRHVCFVTLTPEETVKLIRSLADQLMTKPQQRISRAEFIKDNQYFSIQVEKE